ncbi:hypothetical protein [Pseudomonas entomophila]|uniref:hypothetical protein n=1 Tax=Pseudomonas entomophila TaxID=312306 RepID=UPI00201040C7|nr:hypothetical protein [Pseudomonas entomophila]
MTITDTRNCIDRREGIAPLVLSARTTSRGQTGSLLVQQVSLDLADDQSQITLRRYFEHYDPQCGEWVEYCHSVPTRDLVNWLMAHGQLHIHESRDGAPRRALQATPHEGTRP